MVFMPCQTINERLMRGTGLINEHLVYQVHTLDAEVLGSLAHKAKPCTIHKSIHSSSTGRSFDALQKQTPLDHEEERDL